MAWRGLAGGDLTLEADLSPLTSAAATPAPAPRGSIARVRLTAPARSLTVTGTVGLGGDWPIDLELLASDLTMRGAEIVEGIPEEVRVWLGGRGTVAGPATRPMELTGALRLDTAGGLAVGAASARTEEAGRGDPPERPSRGGAGRPDRHRDAARTQRRTGSRSARYRGGRDRRPASTWRSCGPSCAGCRRRGRQRDAVGHRAPARPALPRRSDDAGARLRYGDLPVRSTT
jgi:hypothetical protein